MKIILASKSGVRKKILEKNNVSCIVVPSNVDEEQVKNSLLAEGANPMLISKNLAELKSVKVSSRHQDQLVLGADSVISLNDMIINKPRTREEGLEILQMLSGSIHYLITSVCISKNGAMVWNFTDQSELKMKKHSKEELIKYLNKISTKTLLAYGVYQIEAGGLNLFETVKGDKDSIMGLPIKPVIDYIKLTS
ncbi:Maf family protein [Pelagibacteraceae bacterium]|jgi:septum formation protein|nr:Maf family protein [Pelagibacteraceae bacterium]